MTVRARTCALCGWRDADHTTLCDGREVSACRTCDPPTAPETATGLARKRSANDFRARQILRAVELNPGATAGDVCFALGVPIETNTRRADARPYMRIVTALYRAVRDGQLRAERIDRGHRRYYPAQHNG